MWRFAFLLVVTVVSCGGDDAGGMGGGGGGGGGNLGDGHLQTSCTIDSDCDDGKRCHIPHCQSQTCTFEQKPCAGADACNAATCDESDGSCRIDPANENGSCTTGQGQPGSCFTGACLALPTCYDPQNSFNSIYCDSSPQDDSTSSTWSSTKAIDTYGNCATGETGPEVAYEFAPSVDGDVTFSLKAKSSANTDGGVADPDLDLIVVEGSCTTQAACLNKSLPDGGFQGITAGTGTERVTFRATVGKTYYVVVDGKNGVVADYTLTVDSCGSCNAASAPALSCNMSMPVSGDTSKGQSLLSSYTCKSQTISGPGNEQPFLFTTTAPYAVTLHATAKVVNASTPVSLMALETTNGACDPAKCDATAQTASGTASVAFDAKPDFNDTVKYWVVVEAGASDATFGLQLACDPYCYNYYDAKLDCSDRMVTGKNDQSSSTNANAGWGPANARCGGLSSLSGSEYVYLFHKTLTTNKPQYRITLAALTPGKHLGVVVLDAGTTDPADCKPNLACANTVAATVAANMTTLASTGTYLAAGPTTAEGGTDGKTAVLDLTTGTTGEHYYWVVVDGQNGDVSDFALSIDSGCP